MDRNIGMYFYKEYWKGCNDAHHITDGTNDTLYNAKLPQYIPNAIGNVSFELMTTYPGLLIGSGYAHEGWKNDENALKLGFYFDYTSGVPCVPGSSIKGVLNSAIDHWDYVLDLCDIALSERLSKIASSDFREAIFGAQKKARSVYSKVIFHDAHAVLVAKDGLLGDDYITPHKNKNNISALDEFSNPTPIHFLKVMPGVTFRFDFYIPDEIEISEQRFLKSDIESIFLYLIKDFGLGAKTNVGYGYLDEDPKIAYQRELDLKYKTEQDLKDKEAKELEEKLQKAKDAELADKKEAEKRRLANIVEQKKRDALAENAGVSAYIDVEKPWKIVLKGIDLYKTKFAFSEDDIGTIGTYLKTIMPAEMSGKDKKSWKKNGKGYWYKVKSWVGEDKATEWFNTLIK